MQGMHLTADLSGCAADAPLMLDEQVLRAHCVDAVGRAGLGAVADIFHRFSPASGQAQGGVTGVVLLAESHLAVHTWPELGAVTLDVYVCNLATDNSAKAECLMGLLIAPFKAGRIDRHQLMRGG